MLPELSGETWVASALLDELTWDLPTAGVDNELVSATCEDKMLQTVRSWVESGNAPPWPACAGLAPELRCWRLQVGNLKLDSLGRLWRRRSPPSVGSQLVVPVRKPQDLIKQFHDSLFAETTSDHRFAPSTAELTTRRRGHPQALRYPSSMVQCPRNSAVDHSV